MSKGKHGGKEVPQPKVKFRSKVYKILSPSQNQRRGREGKSEGEGKVETEVSEGKRNIRNYGRDREGE